MPRLAVLLAAAACALAAHRVASSPSPGLGEQGHAPVRVFAFDDLPGEPDLFHVAFGPDGLLFAASRGGFYTHDGAAWRFHPGVNVHDVLPSLHLDAQGRVFLARRREPLMATPQPDGSYHWTALAAPPLPPEDGLSSINCMLAGDGVWFQALGNLPREFTLWHWRAGVWDQVHANGPRPYLGSRGNIFAVDAAQRLQRLAPGAPQELGPAPLEPPRSVAPLPGADGAWLAATRSGLFRITATSCDPWPNAAADYFRAHPIDQLEAQPDGSLAVVTLDGTVVQLDPAGRWLGLSDAHHGLPDAKFVNAQFDRGAAWLVYSNQIARVDLAATHTLFDATNGLPGGLHALLRHEGVLHAATDYGVFRLEPDAGLPALARWQRVPGVEGRVRALASHESTLLAGGGDGVYARDPGADFKRIEPTNAAVVALRRISGLPGLIYFTRYAVGRIGREDHGWEAGRSLPLSLDLDISGSLAETADGRLWLGSSSRVDVLALDDVPPPTETPAPTAPATLRLRATTTSTEEREGPVGSWPLFIDRQESYRVPPGTLGTGPVLLADAVSANAPLIAARGAFWRVPARHVLLETVSPSPLAHLDRSSARVLALGRESDAATWLAYRPREYAEVAIARLVRDAAGGWQLDESSPRGVSGCRDVRFLLVESGIVWLGGSGGLWRVDTTLAPRAPAPLPPLQLRAQPPAGDRRGEFSYALPHFADAATEILYETRLAPRETAWRAPVTETRREFAGLAAGTYTFAVRALLPDGRRSAAAAFAFTLPTPWWQTGWALTGYALAAAGVAVAFARWRAGRLRRRNLHLEALIAERTEKLSASERALRDAKLAADAANHAKSAFLANMSHELRTPLNAILGFAQILRRSPDVPAAHRDRLAIISRNGDHLLALIDEILDLSKIEAGKLTLLPAAFPLARLVSLTADTFAQRAADKGLEFRTAFAPDLPKQVEGDEAKLRQVLFNLLGNALKFTERGHIALRVTPASPPAAGAAATLLRFEVSDTGIGIGSNDLARLFIPFQQGREPAPASPGTGLGLAISQRLIGLMGGTIRVDSEPGRGSRFCFEIPLPATAAMPADDARLITGYTGPRRRVLVVDDEATNRDVLRSLLEALGFLVEECADGESSLAAFQAFTPHALLLDLRLPGTMDGLAVARAVRALPGGGGVAIIAVSASVFEADRQTAIDAGCDDFVPKPFKEERLLAALHARLGLAWTFDQTPDAPPPPAAPSLQPPLPPAEADALLDLARRGDIRTFRERLKSLAATYPECSHTLARLDQLAAGFQLGRLRQELRPSTGTTP